MLHIAEATDLNQYLVEIAAISHASAKALSHMASTAPADMAPTLTLLYAAAEAVSDKATAARQAITP